MVVVFLENNFFVFYKPSHYRYVVDVLFQLSNAIENSRVRNQTVYVIIFILIINSLKSRITFPLNFFC
jgi:hypothetical protein